METITDPFPFCPVCPRYANRVLTTNYKNTIYVIDHGVLLDRLNKYGFGQIEANWFLSYLTNREQYVVCNNAKSESLTVNYGVPQGSVLGPSLFCLTFNPIANSFVDSKPSLYADDIEAHFSHSNLDLAQSMINQDLQGVDQWLADNKMIPNVKVHMT